MRVLSRSSAEHPIDLTTGEGLHAALQGCEVVIDVVNDDSKQAGRDARRRRRAIARGRAPTRGSIVRATQFHELLNDTLDRAARWKGLPLPRAKLQPVAAEEVAKAVADIAERAPLRDRIQVAGREVTDFRKLARCWSSITGRRLVLLPFPLPGKLAHALRSGMLTTERPDTRARLTFATWLATRVDAAGA